MTGECNPEATKLLMGAINHFLALPPKEQTAVLGRYRAGIETQDDPQVRDLLKTLAGMLAGYHSHFFGQMEDGRGRAVNWYWVKSEKELKRS
jgi:hypothetical protein